VTDLPSVRLAAMVGRQLPVMALILPFYVIALYGGWRSVRPLWPILLIAGASFAAAQVGASHFINYSLAGVLSALTSLIVTLLFVRVWRAPPDPAYATQQPQREPRAESAASAWQAWSPWLIVSATVILWSAAKLPAFGQRDIAWPGLHKAIA